MPNTPQAPIIDTDGMWTAYHHIAKLAELGEDERGNRWCQATYGSPIIRYGNEIDLIWWQRPPQLASQASELCDTGMCYAGWYAALNGIFRDMADSCHIKPFDARRFIRDWAVQHMGINYDQAIQLFAPNNDLTRIRSYLVDITGADRG